MRNTDFTIKNAKFGRRITILLNIDKVERNVVCDRRQIITFMCHKCANIFFFRFEL